DGVRRGRHAGPVGQAGRSGAGSAGGSRGRAEPVPGGQGRSATRRLPVPAERQPGPGPEVRDKLAWSKRLAAHAAKLVKMRTAVVLAGDYNAVPTELDAYNPKSWADDALFL